MKNVIKTLGESLMIPLELTATADPGIHIKIISFGTTTLIISDKNVKYHKNS